MWSDWLVFCDCGFSLSALWCPLSASTILLGFLLPWMWGISPRLLPPVPCSCQHPLDHWKTKRVPVKHLFLLYWLCQSLWLCGSQQSSVWKILKETGIPDQLTCRQRNLCAGQEVTVRTGHGTTDWLQIGKGVCQGCIGSPCLFNFCAEYIWETLGWKKPKLESRLPGEISITSDMQMTPPLWQKVKN